MTIILYADPEALGSNPPMSCRFLVFYGLAGTAAYMNI